MRFFYQYPETLGHDGDMLDAGAVTELAVAVEAAGWHGFCLTEHPAPGARWLAAGGHQSLDPFVALAHVSAVTERLQLLTNLAVAPYRNPLLLAKTAATLDKLSNGRCILGIGTGYLKSEFHALGVDFDERNTLFDETLDVLNLHWSGEPFSYQGTHFDARDIVALPRPVQDPIPVWIGGNSALTRRRVCERAQGWMPLTSEVDLSATTRTPYLPIGPELATKIDEVLAHGRARGAELDITVAYGDSTLLTPALDVERHRDALGQLEAMGVTWVIVAGPTGAPPATFDFVEAFAANYIDRGAAPA